MITEEDVWLSYKQAKNQSTKNWNAAYKRLSEENRNNLYELTKKFNTVWHNIDPFTYMKIGCYLWKSFSYKHFLDRRILNKYIELDKKRKRENNLSEEDIKKSLKYIYNHYSDLIQYSKDKENDRHVAINDYLKNNIDKYTLTYLIVQKYLKVDDFEWNLISYLNDNFKEVKNQMMQYMHIFKRGG